MYGVVTGLFLLGYVAITLERVFRLHKTATALLTGSACWIAYVFAAGDWHEVNRELTRTLGDVSGILFFLLAAMTIVALIEAHHGFEVITRRITTTRSVSVLWIVGLLTFFLAAVLDNMIAAIVMVSLLRKIIPRREDRMEMVGLVVIAANAGAWSPIGAVTTTLLWIGGQVSSLNTIGRLFLPCLACLLAPLLYLTWRMRGAVLPARAVAKADEPHSGESRIVLIAGISSLLMVPVFKSITHLPPYMGILLSLGLLWGLVEFLHMGKDAATRSQYSVSSALNRIDTASILFFLGILLSIGALESCGQLAKLSEWLMRQVPNQNLMVFGIGVLSAIVDNVPLVAASMHMYSLEAFPMDHSLWQFLAYCAGTGGSILIIGSAAGIAVMGMEKIDFFWYVRRVSALAFLGYCAGALVYLIQLWVGL